MGTRWTLCLNMRGKMQKSESIQEIKAQLERITDQNDLRLEWLNDSRQGVQTALKSWYKKQEKRKEQQQKLEYMMRYEKDAVKQGYQLIGGIDEVGRGPLAGPVVAACVIMPLENGIVGIDDSKKLSEKKRQDLYNQIMQQAISVGVGVVNAETIDDVNIYQATKLAMQQAIDNMPIKPDYVLIDAMQLDNGLPQQSLIKGDANSYQIAAASIVAKVTRDRLMKEYAQQYPHYDFENNAGYGTPKHLEGLQEHGVTPIHRRTFEPIKSMI